MSIDSFGLRCPNPHGSVNNFVTFSALSVEPMTPRQLAEEDMADVFVDPVDQGVPGTYARGFCGEPFTRTSKCK